MSAFTETLAGTVYESVIDILSSKGIEDKICVSVANQVVDLFEQRLVTRQQNAAKIEETSIVQKAIEEADIRGRIDSTS